MNENETENNMAPVPAFNHPLDWIRIFGPGAVIASLTIGSGELIFSTRGGALFGYPLLWIFLVVCILKWILVYSGSRHLILSGVHPIQRWMDLPGPRGWLPLTFLILAIISFPIWVSFHAGTLGTLLNALTPSADGQDSYAYYLWGALLSGGVLALILSGSYQRLERIQLILVCTMLAGVTLSLFMLGPVWLDLLSGLIPQKIAYPNWIDSLEAFRNRPLAVEIGTYVGVIGGGAYDYLAYMSYLREKKWGQAGKPPANNAELIEIEKHIDHPNRRWLRAPMIDCAISFLLIFIFSTVFLACGKIVLGSQQMVPSGTNLLTFQAAIVNSSFPWMKSFYFVGAFLAMFGTLYGTIEVAPAILKEIQIALGNPFPDMNTNSCDWNTGREFPLGNVYRGKQSTQPGGCSHTGEPLHWCPGMRHYLFAESMDGSQIP